MAGLWLHFGDNLAKANTKHRLFSDLVRADDVRVLEGLRELTLRREQACLRECFKQPGATLADQAQWFEKYLSLLRQFVAAADQWQDQLQADRAGFIWSSPLSNLAADARLSLRSVHCEEIMALCMYAAILQQQAYELASQLLAAASGDRMGGSGTVGGGSGGGSRALEASLSGLSLSSAASFGRSLSSPDKEQGAVSADPSSSAAGSSGSMAAAGSEAADHAQVATLYRRAAGIFKHIAEVLYPAAVAAPGFPTGERPVEVWEGAGEAMQALCLAQAQGVAAHRAEMRGTSPGLVAALQRGAAGMYEQASAKLRGIKPPSSGLTAAVPALSERLRRFLAISATLHEARALRALAASCRADLELGQAVACLRDALSKVRQCLVVCEKDEDWRAALQPELEQLTALHQAYEKERDTVFLQRVPAAPPPLPAARVIVSPLPYEPPDCGDTYFH